MQNNTPIIGEKIQKWVVLSAVWLCRNIVRYGFKNGHQRFKCKNCGRIFNEVTNSVFMCSKKSFDIWEKYIECMINEFTIRKSAKICKICITTAFVWRHKNIGCIIKKNLMILNYLVL